MVRHSCWILDFGEETSLPRGCEIRRENGELRERAGIRVCEQMAKRGVLTRPIGNVIVIMPPYCTTRQQVQRMVQALADGISAAGL